MNAPIQNKKSAMSYHSGFFFIKRVIFIASTALPYSPPSYINHQTMRSAWYLDRKTRWHHCYLDQP